MQRLSRKLLEQILWPSDFFDKNIDDFWSSVRRSTQSSTILSNCIDDVTGEVDISNFWKEHFERILNGGICNAQLKQSVVGKLQSMKYDENKLVNSEDIRNIVNKLKCGKSVANYGASVWSTNVSATSIGKIQTAQNEALRIATGSHKMSSIDHLHNKNKNKNKFISEQIKK